MTPQTLTCGSVVRPSHLLLNALDIRLRFASNEDEKWIEEKELMAATREATRELLLRGCAVEAEFDWIEDDFYYSPEIDEEILTLESVNLVKEKPGSRYVTFTEKGEDLRDSQHLLDATNADLSDSVLAIVRETIAACLRR